MAIYLRFECGGRLPREGTIPDADFCNRHKKDGRPRLCVASTQDKVDRPMLPDGTNAPCHFACPAKRASGRKLVRVMPRVDPKPGEPLNFGYVVTCYAREVPHIEPGIAALDDARNDPEGGMGGDD